MKKLHKKIGFYAAIVLVSGATATAAIPVKPFSQIKSKIGSFVFGTETKDKEATAKKVKCMHDALTAYRASLKDSRDKYVSLTKELRAGYKAAVGEAMTNLRNVNSSDKDLKKEKKKELSTTRNAAVKTWSDKLAAARLTWNEAQKSAINAYRATHKTCSGQTDDANLNTNANINADVNENANTNENVNTNLNANENSNANTNF
jgi:hypothetical protein